MQSQDWQTAISNFIQSLDQDGTQAHVYYMLGQSYRFSDNLPLSISSLNTATQLNDQYKEWFLALGIALQLNDNLHESLTALRRANALDPDYDLAYNSAGVTFRKLGKFEEAANVYDMCAEAMIRNFLFNVDNSPDNAIHDFHETTTSIYVQYTLKAMIEHSSRADISKVAFPDGEFEDRERKTKKHGGLLWFDQFDEDETIRMYLPNSFDTVREFLSSSSMYYTVLENKAHALNMLNKGKEANECLTEAASFQRMFESFSMK